MPVLMPTPDEMSRMSHAQRAKARRALWAIIRETDVYLDRTVRAIENQVSFGEHIRSIARDLERIHPQDPPHVTAARRHALMEAIR